MAVLRGIAYARIGCRILLCPVTFGWFFGSYLSDQILFNEGCLRVTVKVLSGRIVQLERGTFVLLRNGNF